MRPVAVLGTIVAAALVLRAVHVLEIRDSVLFESPLVDAHVYDEAARAMAAAGPGALEVPYYQPPLYPMLLAAIYAVTGGSYLVPRLLQALLGALTTGLVFVIGSRLAGTRAGVSGAVALAAYGVVIWFEGELLPVTLVLFLNTAAVLLLLRADEGGLRRPVLGAGVLLGISAAARPTSLLLAIGAIGWWLGRRTGRGGRGTVALLVLAVLVPILPFTVENVRRGGELVLVSYNGGINFYLGNGAGSDSLTAIQPGYAWDRLQVEPHRAGVTSRAAESRYWVRRGLAEMAGDPVAWVGALARKAVRLLDARETPRNLDYRVWRRESRLLSLPLVGFATIAPLALLGLGLPGLSRRARALLSIALAAVAVQNLLFFVTARYRAEAVPVLCVLAGLGIERLLRHGWRGTGLPALAAAGGLLLFVAVDWLGERRIDETRAALNRGVALHRAGLRAGAARELQEALRRSPGHPDAHRLLGSLALDEGNWSEALFHFDRSLSAAPDYLFALLGRAQALERAGRAAEAERTYRETIAIDPWSFETRLNYGVLLAKQDRLDEARAMFEEGLRLAPHDERLRRNLERVERLR